MGHDQEGRRGLNEVVPGTSVFPLSETGVLKNSTVLCYSISHVQFFAIPWTVAHQASPSMEFPRQEYWRGMPRPSLGDLPDPGIEPVSLKSLASARGSFTTSAILENMKNIFILFGFSK